MSYWHTPRHEWPTRAEAMSEPSAPPIDGTETHALIAELTRLQEGADQ